MYLKRFVEFLLRGYKHLNKYPRLLALCLIFTSFLVIFLSPLHVAVVRHQSVKYKMVVWREKTARLPIERGDYILIPWKGEDPNDMGLEDGTLLVKRVGCAAGDVLTVHGSLSHCNGRVLGRAYDRSPDSEKLLTAYNFPPIKNLAGSEIFLIGDYVRSYDSRYLGLLSANDAIGKVVFGL